jgi:hypothetical protein
LIQRSDVSAMTLTSPPQREQISTSISPKAPTVGKHFLTAEPRSWPFVVHQAFCLLLNHPFVYLSLALLVWLLAGTDCLDGAAFRQKHSEPREVNSQFGHQWCQVCNDRSCASMRPRYTVLPVHNIRWFKYEVHGHTDAE